MPDYGRGIELSPENDDIYEDNIPANRDFGGNTVEIKNATRDGATILYITGRIDTATAPELERAINKEIEPEDPAQFLRCYLYQQWWPAGTASDGKKTQKSQ
jgi:hypothetical protein